MCFRIALGLLLVTLAGENFAQAEENSKTFDASHCRYTLPGKDWTWQDTKGTPGTICAASNGKGLAFVLSVMPLPDRRTDAVVNDAAIRGFDKTAYGTAHMKKLDGRITTFETLSCYESEGIVDGAAHSLMRVVMANGYAYLLQIVGEPRLVANRADCETIFNGFEFTSPPVVTTATNNFSYHMGQIAGGCLMLALIFFVARRFF